MIEILVLINITKIFGRLATQKGLSAGLWKLYIVLAWFFAEFTGIFIGVLLFPDTMLVYLLFGYSFAAAAYYLLKYILNKKPDLVDDEWLAQLGQAEETGKLDEGIHYN